MIRPSAGRLKLEPSERDACLAFLEAKKVHAQNALSTLRVMVTRDPKTTSENQIIYWTDAVAIIDWLIYSAGQGFADVNAARSK